MVRAVSRLQQPLNKLEKPVRWSIVVYLTAKNPSSETAHETLDWNVGDCEWLRGPAGDRGYKAKLTKKRSYWSRDISQQYFFVKVVFFGMSSPCFGCSWCCVFLLMQDSRNTAVSCTSGLEEQLCGLNRQSTSGDESTHSAAPRQTLKLWGPPCAVYHLPDFSLHIRC